MVEPSVSELKKWECPRCSGYIPNNETPGAYMGAISRRDNKTEICSACGTQEALEDFFNSQSHLGMKI
jgi:ribosomal protein S27AE